MSDAGNFGIAARSREKLLSLFASYPQVERVIIYGSRAMGTHKVGSDIDLTLIGKDLDTSHLIRILSDIEDLSLAYTVDLSILSSLSSEGLLDHIKRLGRDFYAKKVPPGL